MYRFCNVALGRVRVQAWFLARLAAAGLSPQSMGIGWRKVYPLGTDALGGVWCNPWVQGHWVGSGVTPGYRGIGWGQV